MFLKAAPTRFWMVFTSFLSDWFNSRSSIYRSVMVSPSSGADDFLSMVKIERFTCPLNA